MTKPKAVKRSSVFTYLLRTCGPNGESYGGFRWPLTVGAKVVAPDFNATPHCGFGLHGLLMGEGDQSLLNNATEAKWMVVKVRRSELVSIDKGAKYKVPRAEVVFVGDCGGAAAFLIGLGANAEKIPGAQMSASGDYGQASASGYQGQASASGTKGQASASGTKGQASASGDYGQASASGYQGQASASGDYGQASASGTKGQASASGYQGQASASGDYGQASASGDYGQASAEGKDGVALARGSVRAGAQGILIGFWFDGVRDRVVVRYVGEDGIKPNTWYTIDRGVLTETPNQ